MRLGLKLDQKMLRYFLRMQKITFKNKHLFFVFLVFFAVEKSNNSMYINGLGELRSYTGGVVVVGSNPAAPTNFYI